MSIVSGLSDLLSDLQKAILREKNKFENDARQTTDSMVSEVRTKFERIFNDLRNFKNHQENLLKQDFDDVKSLFDDIEAQIVGTADKAFHTIETGIESEFKKIDTFASTSIGKIETTSKDIRTKIASEISNAIAKAKSDFIKIKDDFKKDIETVSKDIITKTRDAVSVIKESATDDLTTVNDFRKSIDSDIEKRFDEVRQTFTNIKNIAQKELESISEIVRGEVENMEKKIKKLSTDVKATSFYIGLSVLMVAIAASLVIIAEKEKRYNRKLMDKSIS